MMFDIMPNKGHTKEDVWGRQNLGPISEQDSNIGHDGSMEETTMGINPKPCPAQNKFEPYATNGQWGEWSATMLIACSQRLQFAFHILANTLYLFLVALESCNNSTPQRSAMIMSHSKIRKHSQLFGKSRIGYALAAIRAARSNKTMGPSQNWVSRWL